MKIEEAVRILDPATTAAALYGLPHDEAVELVEAACRLAVDNLRENLEAAADACSRAVSSIRDQLLTEVELERCRAYGVRWVSRDDVGKCFVKLWKGKPMSSAGCYVGREQVALVHDVSLFPSVQPGGCVCAERAEEQPLTLEELREMTMRCEGIYIANIDGRPLFRERKYCAAVLDMVPTYGGPAHIQAIYGEKLSLWEDDYGKTWVAYRRPPVEVQHDDDD